MMPSTPDDSLLLEDIRYEGDDESDEFDALLRSREVTRAARASLSERTYDKILYSPWHVPCHCIIARTRDGICQAFHAHRWEHASALTREQELALEQLGKEGGHVIVAVGERGIFTKFDQAELTRMGLVIERIIQVATRQWWRLLYEPLRNQIWIDAKVEKSLRKYRGFQ